MNIDGIEYVPVSENSLIKIVVCDRGFVLVGKVTIENNYVTITQCSCIRNWGTKNGLGQLAKEGPQASTKLDAQPTTTVHELQVVMMIDCEEKTWKL